MSRPLQVFLCHASQDKPAVRELYQRLKSEDWIDPWLDATKLLPGQEWMTEIENAVDKADVVIICLSNHSINKEGYIQKEIRQAFGAALTKLDNSIFLIPVRLDNCNVPKKLSDYQWLDYYGTNKEYADSKLLESLKQRHKQLLEIESEQLKLKQIEDQKREDEERKAAFQKIEEKIKQDAEEERLNREREKQLRRDARRRELEKKISRDIRRKKQKEFLDSFLRLISPRFTMLNITVFVFVIILLFILFGRNYLIDYINIPVAFTPQVPSSTPKLITPTQTVTNTPESTATLIPIDTPIATLGYGVGSIIVSELDGMVLVYVPEGEFIMGSDNNKPNERPAHEVSLSAYWIDQTEVTNKMYMKCVQAGAWACEEPNVLRSESQDNYFYNLAFENYPVVAVTWQMAYSYCQWAGRRLPTEAEWEKAARGTDERMYPWGNDTPKSNLLNFNPFGNDTTIVGSYPKGISPYGVFDMAGNVSEWVYDFYDEIYYIGSPKSDPEGPLQSLDLKNRVIRGGSWRDGDTGVRVTDRSWYDQSYTLINLGFRCAMDADQ